MLPLHPIRRRRTGFTLVELLVVIGIIALLISMLLPALNKARESGKSIVCASNLRQMGIAFTMYTEASKGWLPAGSMNSKQFFAGKNHPGDATSAGLNVDSWLHLLINSGALRSSGDTDWIESTRLPVMQCPNAQAGPKFVTMWSYKPSVDLLGFPKGTGAAPSNPVPAMSKITDLRPASNVILLAEAFHGQPNTWTLFQSPHGVGGQAGHGWAVRHGKRANFLLADGHVDSHLYQGTILHASGGNLGSWNSLFKWETAVQNLKFRRASSSPTENVDLGLNKNW